MKCFGRFIVLSVFLFQCVNMQYNQCLSPQNNYGYCIPLSYCSYVVSLLRYYPQNSYILNYVRQSICGIDRRSQQYVCCPPNNDRPTSQVQQHQAEDRLFNKGNSIQPASVGGQEYEFEQPKVMDMSSEKLMKCGFDLDNRIFGGAKSNINDFNWLVLLRYAKSGSSLPNFRCAGSLINNRYVLTAAHCVHPRLLYNTKLISARLGEHNLLLDEDCQTLQGRRICAPRAYDVPIEEVMIHEKYSPQSLNQHNDIALVRLNRKVQLNDFIKPICLQQDKTMTITELLGQTLVVAGFGQTENSQSSTVKLQVSLNVVENEQCNKIFRKEGRLLGNGQICAGGNHNEDSCKGDSGGPLMKLVNKNGQLFWVLYGIVSYGTSPCGLAGNPGVYTKVDQYVEWIESKLKA